MSQNLQSPVLKRFSLKLYSLIAFFVIITATAFRFGLYAAGWKITNGDEAFMQLTALHIYKQGEVPIFFYGQHYMGVLEAYLGAAMFQLMGVSFLAMRIPMILLYTGFLICLYLLASRVYNRTFALICLLFLAGGSWPLMTYQTLASGGYPELPFLGALFFLLAYQLAASYKQMAWYKRLLLYSAWGLVVGLSLWCDLLILPYVAVAELLLLICCWKEFWKWGLWVSLCSIAIGAFPLLIYNIDTLLKGLAGQDSISILLQTSQVGAGPGQTLLQHFEGTFLISLPAFLGIYPDCFLSQLPLHISSHPHGLTCAVLQGTWGLGYPILLFIAIVLTVMNLWHMWRSGAFTLLQKRSEQTLVEQKTLARQVTSLMLLIGAALTVLAYLRSPASTFALVTNARYLICLLISMPAILWPLWNGLGQIKTWPRYLTTGLILARWTILAVVVAASILATSSVLQSIPSIQTQDQQMHDLEQKLEQMGVTRFYSEYWTCSRLIFMSQEQLMCGDTFVVDGNLMHGSDRYQPYREAVVAAKNPAFVYPIGTTYAITLEQHLQATHIPYQHLTMDGYEIYLPAYHIPDVKIYQ